MTQPESSKARFQASKMSGISATRLSAVTEGWFAPPSEADIAQRWVDLWASYGVMGHQAKNSG